MLYSWLLQHKLITVCISNQTRSGYLPKGSPTTLLFPSSSVPVSSVSTSVHHTYHTAAATQLSADQGLLSHYVYSTETSLETYLLQSSRMAVSQGTLQAKSAIVPQWCSNLCHPKATFTSAFSYLCSYSYTDYKRM